MSPQQPAQPQRAGTRDLNAALAACFDQTTQSPPFARRLVEIAAALTSSTAVSIWTLQADAPPELAAFSGPKPDPEPVTGALNDSDSSQSNAPVRMVGTHLLALIALPNGQDAAMWLAPPPGGTPALALAFERVSLLSHIASARFRHPEVVGLSKLVASVQKLGPSEPEALQTLADTLSALTGADHVAAGFWSGHRIEQIAISGQSGMTTRASAPARLKEELAQTARRQPNSGTRVFAANPGKGPDLALLIENPTQGAHLPTLAGALYAQFAPDRAKGRTSWSRIAKRAAVVTAIAAAGFIPIPDGVEVPATVIAQNHRIVTAPLSTTLADLHVEDGEQVKAGQVLAEFDAQDAELELVRLGSERAAAVIERENARLNGNAAGLRNAELTVARLDANIALETSHAENATLTAPIAGTVILGDLAQRVGSSMRQGDQLLEIADPSSLMLELTILQNDIGAVVAGDTGLFRPDFDPSRRKNATITAISPAIDFSAELPVAPAKAHFEAQPDGLRPGLTGVVMVGDARRPIWQVLYGNLRDWILLRVWL